MLQRVGLLKVIEVPVPVKPWAHHLQVVHDVQRELLLRRLLTRLAGTRLRRWCEQEAVEAAVTAQNDVAHLHLAGERFQIIPDLLGLAVEIHVAVYLLLSLEVGNVLAEDFLPL